MPRTCFVTKKRTYSQKTSTRSGLARAKGGVGVKRTGVHKRTQKPNLQKKTLWIDGKPQRVWLSTSALRSLDPAMLTPPARRKA